MKRKIKDCKTTLMIVADVYSVFGDVLKGRFLICFVVYVATLRLS